MIDLTYLISWIITCFFIILQILEKVGLIDKIYKKIVRGPYKWADEALLDALIRCEDHFYLITGEADFLDEPWGKLFLENLKKLQGNLRDQVKILISGDPKAPRVIEKINILKQYGFKDAKDIEGEEHGDLTLYYYPIKKGLQAAAMNEKECWIKIEKREIKIKKQKGQNNWQNLFSIKTHERRQYNYIVRYVVRRYTDVDIRKLIEGYFYERPKFIYHEVT